MAIQSVFTEGLHVNREDQQFILSTISISDICTLETLISDPSDCECDSLIELVYFPDESVQIKLENRFEARRRDHNMETLMAQGIRIPHTDRQALLLQVALADDICLALFNRSM